MQSITELNILNKKPTLYISYEGLEAIKHIVSIAPQEAQWFHTIEVENENTLVLSDRIYIPEQNTSAAQVDSTSEMLINFYKELSKEFKTEEVNHILQNMGCWCHSHHNMGVSPSGQDVKQFTEFVKSSIEQNQNTWQIMLIFNKKDQFYCRAYDPKTGIIYEGLDLEIYHTYDFDYIDKAAKTKFKKPKPKFNSYGFKSKKNQTKTTYTSPNWLYQSSQESLFPATVDSNGYVYPSKINDYANEGYYDELAEHILSGFNQKTIKFNQNNLDELVFQMQNHLDDREFCLFSYMLANNKKSLIRSWSLNEGDFNILLLQDAEDKLRTFMKSKTRSKRSLISKMSTFLDILDLKNDEAIKIIKELN
jgi:hypothetical protein